MSTLLQVNTAHKSLVFPLIFACISMITLSACELERGDSTFEDQQVFDSGFTVDNDTDIDADALDLGAGSGAGTMTGTWMLIHEASTCVFSQEQVTTAFYLIDIKQDGEGPVLHERRQLCDMRLSAVLGLTPVIPLSVLETIAFTDIDLGLISSLRPRAGYTSSTEVALWGVKLTDPLRDKLPEDPEDPAVFDADNDGEPGVTLLMEGTDCKRYVAQRQIVRYTGTLTTPNQIDGTSTTLTDTEVFSATQPLCAINPPLEANDRHNRFRMVRIDGLGGSFNADSNGDKIITCAEIEPILDLAWQRRAAAKSNCRH